MGGPYTKRRFTVRLTIPPEQRELFGRFNTLCIIRGLRKEEAYAQAVETELARYDDLLKKEWIDWEGLTHFMRRNGYALSRTTFWHYRNKGLFQDATVTDGISTLFDANAILSYFKDGKESR